MSSYLYVGNWGEQDFKAYPRETLNFVLTHDVFLLVLVGQVGFLLVKDVDD